MLSDLRFSDERLEALFCETLSASRRKVVNAFSLFRALILIFMVIRAYLGEDWSRQDLLILLGAATNIAPLLAVQRPLPAGLVSPLRYASILTDIVQAAIGCTNHHRVAPSRPGLRPLAAVAYLPYGSTALWIFFYTAFSFLPFYLELLKAALVCTVLVSYSSSLCSRSPGLLAGYTALCAAGRPALAGALRRLHAIMPLAFLWPGAVPANAADVAGRAPPAQQPARWASWWHSWHTPGQLPEQHCPLGAAGQDVCVQSQLVVLLLAFLGSVWAVHRSQLRARLHFLHSCHAIGGSSAQRQAEEEEQQRQRSGHRQQPELDLGVAAAEELAEPLPSSLDFLSLAVPALLCALFAFNMPWRGSIWG